MALLFSSQFSSHVPQFAEIVFSGKDPKRDKSPQCHRQRDVWFVVRVTGDVHDIDALSVEEDYDVLSAYTHFLAILG